MHRLASCRSPRIPGPPVPAALPLSPQDPKNKDVPSPPSRLQGRDLRGWSCEAETLPLRCLRRTRPQEPIG